jgi:hypothetical protein
MQAYPYRIRLRLGRRRNKKAAWVRATLPYPIDPIAVDVIPV